jgi:hypothetical protein
LSGCATHREYLAALADGEADLVPEATIDHVEQCADCAAEVQAHRLLSARLREASEHLDRAETVPVPRASRWRRAGLLTGGAAAVLALSVGAAAWSVLSRPDPVQAAVLATSGPLQFESTDPYQVGDWCQRASGRWPPVVQLDWLKVVGARADRFESTEIVTVTYTTSTDGSVSVSWLEGQASGGPGVQQESVSGRNVLIVHVPQGTAVVAGSSSGAMWDAAAAIESESAP